MTTVVVSLVTLVAGTILGVWATSWVHRPKLTVTGASGGGNVQPHEVSFHRYSVVVANRPTFVGLRFGQTTIGGRDIHNPVSWGQHVERNTTEAQAWVLLGKEGAAQTQLFMERLPDGGPPVGLAKLANGEEVWLHVFVLDPRTGEYFIFQHDSDGDPVKPRAGLYTGDNEFQIRVGYDEGTRQLKIRATVTQFPDGHLDVIYR